MLTPGTIIMLARQGRGWTRKEAAAALDIPLSTLERYELGHCLPSQTRACILCEALQIDPGEMVSSIAGVKQVLDEIRMAVRAKKYKKCQNLYQQLALQEQVPGARRRYLDLAELSCKIWNEYQLAAVLNLGRK